MKYIVIPALLSMLMIFTLTNASPLQVKKDLESGNIQELLSELKSSNAQAENKREPVVISTANKVSSLDLVIAQDCGWIDWLECGGVVVACAASCYTLNAPACITCLGSSYSQCAGCVSRQKQLLNQKQGKIMQSQNELISSNHVANAQGCDLSEWYECGTVVVQCAQSCYDLQAASCISCAGDSYYTCKDCFSRLEEIEMQRAVMEAKHHVANAQSCGLSEWYECGSVVVKCAQSCYNLQAASCISCAGNSYYTCKDCFSRLKEVKMQEAVMKAKHLVANAQDCDLSEWYECGSVVVQCAQSCYDLQAASCISCAGDSYYTCKDCFSQLKEVNE